MNFPYRLCGAYCLAAGALALFSVAPTLLRAQQARSSDQATSADMRSDVQKQLDALYERQGNKPLAAGSAEARQSPALARSPAPPATGHPHPSGTAVAPPPAPSGADAGTPDNTISSNAGEKPNQSNGSATGTRGSSAAPQAEATKESLLNKFRALYTRGTQSSSGHERSGNAAVASQADPRHSPQKTPQPAPRTGQASQQAAAKSATREPQVASAAARQSSAHSPTARTTTSASTTTQSGPPSASLLKKMKSLYDRDEPEAAASHRSDVPLAAAQPNSAAHPSSAREPQTIPPRGGAAPDAVPAAHQPDLPPQPAVQLASGDDSPRGWARLFPFGRLGRDATPMPPEPRDPALDRPKKPAGNAERPGPTAGRPSAADSSSKNAQKAPGLLPELMTSRLQMPDFLNKDSESHQADKSKKPAPATSNSNQSKTASNQSKTASSSNQSNTAEAGKTANAHTTAQSRDSAAARQTPTSVAATAPQKRPRDPFGELGMLFPAMSEAQADHYLSTPYTGQKLTESKLPAKTATESAKPDSTNLAQQTSSASATLIPVKGGTSQAEPHIAQAEPQRQTEPAGAESKPRYGEMPPRQAADRLAARDESPVAAIRPQPAEPQAAASETAPSAAKAEKARARQAERPVAPHDPKTAEIAAAETASAQTPADAQPQQPVAQAANREPEAAAGDSPAEKMRRIAARQGRTGFKGFCPVALRDRRDLQDARVEFSSVHKGRTYHFASKEAKAAFDAQPSRYAPAAGGSDVVLFLEQGKRVEGSLDHAVWFRDRLYLFSSAETMQTFASEPAKFSVGAE